MISIKNRFHGHNSLRQVYQKGKPVYSANCKLLWLPNTKQTYRAAVVVSKKVHKSAVVRNRIRRRLYECVRTFIKEDPRFADMVFVIQNDKLASLEADILHEEISGLLKKINS